MYSNAMMYSLLAVLAVLIIFLTHSLGKERNRLIHRLYAMLAGCCVVWILAMLGMRAARGRHYILFALDAVTNMTGTMLAVSVLLIALTFTRGWQRLPAYCHCLFVPPLVTTLMVFTNPLHNLYYKQFAVNINEIQFGPYFITASVFNYACFLIATFITLRFGIRSGHKLYLKQALVFSAGVLIPLSVNMVATLRIIPLSIAATPLSFAATVLCHGTAIFNLNFLNLKPVALQNMLDSISDCYVILAPDGYVVDFNQSFGQIFGRLLGIQINAYPMDLLESERPPEAKTAIYNLLNSFESCKQSHSVIAYEQAVFSESAKRYYAVELTPLMVKKGQFAGCIAMFKEVTRLREDMQREQANLSRTMERERLASLGQMIGGIAHNLKTPIMSVAGSVGVLGKLVDEYAQSVGDEEVTVADHLEIGRDMREWLSKIQDCCSYMSELITTVKGLATNMNTSAMSEFTMDELTKRVLLLMQHSLLRGGCTLQVENNLPPRLRLKGDINNLVQVVSNLVDNAIDAMKEKGGGEILLRGELRGKDAVLSVTDTGGGVPEEVRGKLFREMYTTKGAMGTGLGLYISNSLVRGKFDGSMWFEDNPAGGSVFFIRIPGESTVL